MIKNTVRVSAYTCKYNGLANSIITKAKVSSNEITDSENAIDVSALWDTGATNCAISLEVAKRLKLISKGKAKVYTANGETLQNTYIINLTLPNGLFINDVPVTEIESISGADIIIGMYVIAKGDFSITNKDNKTVMSFRTPSLSTTDYVELIKRQSMAKTNKIGRNEPCPCGSGKKYKNCCGRN